MSATTVAEEIAALQAWLDDDTRRPGVEWEQRGIERAQSRIVALAAFPADMPLLTVERAALGTHPWLSDIDRWAIRWQHQANLGSRLSEFEVKLLSLVEVADDGNLDKLYTAFPDVVAMIRAWRGTDLAERLRELPFAFDL